MREIIQPSSNRPSREFKADMSKAGTPSFKPDLRAALAVLVLAAAHTPVWAQEKDTRAEWNQPVEPYRIAGNVYYVGVRGIATYLVATPQGHILVDGGYEETAPVILGNVRKLGFRPADVKFLVVTHAHNDHAGGLAALKAATGAQLLALAAERKALEEGYNVGEFDYGVQRFTPVRVDRTLRDGETVRLGGSALTVHWTPGHTQGCTSFALPVVEQGRRHTALFFCSTTVAGNRLIGNKVYPEIVSGFRETFARLKRIRADIFLPNHPGFADLEGKRARVAAGRPNPFIDSGELQRFVARSERAFNAELARQRGVHR